MSQQILAKKVFGDRLFIPLVITAAVVPYLQGSLMILFQNIKMTSARDSVCEQFHPKEGSREIYARN